MGTTEEKINHSPAVTIRDARVVFTDFVETDPRVVSEAARWTTGRRGANAPEALVEGADLSAFASTALRVGSEIMSFGTETASVTSLAGTVVQLADRAEAANAALTNEVVRATTQASETAVKAARDAAKVTSDTIAEARKQVAQDVAETVGNAATQVEGGLDRLLGGDDTPITRAIRDLVTSQMADCSMRMQRTFAETLGSVSQALDVANPTSPLARLESRIAERDERHHAEMTAGLEKVRETMAAATAAAQAAAAVATAKASSPAKGRPFEEAIGSAMEDIASGLGGCYAATGETAGAIRGCKKGDGVLELPALDGVGEVRIVIEATTTGAARKWGPYLAEAERNRCADASIGIVPSTDLVPGHAALAPIAPNRIVVAHNGDADSQALLRAATVLLALRVQRDAIRGRSGLDVAAADARISEAEQLLGGLGDVLKAAMGVKAGATKVVAGIEGFHEALARALGLARSALRGAIGAAPPNVEVA